MNESLRRILEVDSDIIFEVYNENGVYYASKGTNGFDFGWLDKEHNLSNLWNLYLGKISLYDGASH